MLEGMHCTDLCEQEKNKAEATIQMTKPFKDGINKMS